MIKREHRYLRGVDDVLQPGETVWMRRIAEIGTMTGPVTVTAVRVAKEGQLIGRIVVETLEPPVCYSRFDKSFVEFLGKTTIYDGDELPVDV